MERKEITEMKNSTTKHKNLMKYLDKSYSEMKKTFSTISSKKIKNINNLDRYIINSFLENTYFTNVKMTQHYQVKDIQDSHLILLF